MSIIIDKHRELLKLMGLKEDDFSLFDGEFVRYEFDEEKGVRIYDPYYTTSYTEYIGIDGWSAWSTERDTFMSDILKGVREKAEQREVHSPKTNHNNIRASLKDKFTVHKQDKG